MSNEGNSGCGSLVLVWIIGGAVMGYARYPEIKEQQEKDSQGCFAEFSDVAQAKKISQAGAEEVDVWKAGEKCIASIEYKDGTDIKFEWAAKKVSPPKPSDIKPL
ncbi:MAG: hypothetical protein V4621_00040 [Pseudomonadota bacterium]